MRHEFVNERPIVIDPGLPNKIQSAIVVPDLGAATVENLEIHLDITHTWTGDLRIKLFSPDGTEVLLVNRRVCSPAPESKERPQRAEAATDCARAKRRLSIACKRCSACICG